MNEETTQTPAEEAASNTAGENGAGKKPSAGFGAAVAATGMGGEKGRMKSRRRKVSYLTINKIATVDYKDVATLRRFINDRGKILSSKVTGNTASQQRMIASAIRQAREMALLPFVVTEMTHDRPVRMRGPRQYEGNREQSAPAPAPAAEEASTEA